MTTISGEHTALLSKKSYEEEAITHLEAQADAGRACGGIAGRHKDPQHQECPAKDMAWTCSSSAAIILLAVLIVLPLALVSYPVGDESSELVASLPILGSSKKNKRRSITTMSRRMNANPIQSTPSELSKRPTSCPLPLFFVTIVVRRNLRLRV